MNLNRLSRYIKLLHIFLIRDGYKRANYLYKIGYFASQGKGCYFQPYNFGTEPELISFGNNVHIASDVMFITHDITALMFSKMDETKYINRYGKIAVGNNVFFGARSTVLYGVKIGDNVIIGAGCLVNKNIPDNCVVGGGNMSCDWNI